MDELVDLHLPFSGDAARQGEHLTIGDPLIGSLPLQHHHLCRAVADVDIPVQQGSLTSVVAVARRIIDQNDGEGEDSAFLLVAGDDVESLIVPHHLAHHMDTEGDL